MNNMTPLYVSILLLACISSITSRFYDGPKRFITMDIYSSNVKNSSHIVDTYNLQNNFYTHIKVGSNDQEIVMRLRLDSFSSILIDNKNVSGQFRQFNPNTSSTYSRISDKKWAAKEFYNGALSLDVMTFVDDGLKLKNFHFFYVTELNKREHMPAGFIGLDLEKSHSFHKHTINFVDQLERNQFIEGFGTTFVFNKKNRLEGKILFGPDLDEIFHAFEGCKKTRIMAGGTKGRENPYWGFEFDSIHVGADEIGGAKKATLTLDVDYIISTDEYSEHILRVYFNEFLENKVCTLESIPAVTYFKYIKCDPIVLGAIERLPDLSFSGRDVNNDVYQMNFTHRELFEVTEEAVFFKIILIVPPKKLNVVLTNEWIIGKIFFEKFVVTLDRKRQSITFYSETHLQNIYDLLNYLDEKILSKDQLIKQDNVPILPSKDGDNSYTFVLYILGVAVVSGFLFLFMKKMSKKGKTKKRNEQNLSNEYELSSQLNTKE